MPKTSSWSNLSLSLGILFLASLAVSHFVDNPVTLLTGMIAVVSLVLTVPIATFCGIRQYGLFSRSWLPPPMICLAFLLSFAYMGRIAEYINNLQFRARLGEYDSFVHDVKTGRIQGKEFFQPVGLRQGRHLPGNAIAAWAIHCGHATVLVTFLISNEGRVGFGYVFDDCDDPGISMRHALPGGQGPGIKHITGPWYEFSEG